MSDDTRHQPTAQTFVPVCAIGASAGGVTALQGLFRQLPDDLGLAYVVILHLSPDQPSALSEILSVCTRMPVLQIDDGPILKPNCVYVIPPDRELVIEGDSVTARHFTEPRGRRAPIDMFFRSIAAARGDGIAVVLSGAGSDGTLGLRAVKEAGGVIMVQEPAEAGFGSMPQNAIATGDADFVAPLARLAERLAEVARSKEAVRSLDMDGSANELRRIVAFLRARTGHDFSSYKRATVMRRVLRRMQVCRTDTLGAYSDYLLTAPEETKELFSDLLISVTMFFRDPGSFMALERLVVGPLFDEMDPGAEASIRAWVVGCATGEEAYSLAMLILEEASRRKLHPTIQIFATDLDEGALATAREGRYPRTIEADISEERLARFFINEGTHYHVRKELRDCVLFAKHSAIKEPPFMRLDLVTCRNLLIYLERSLQQQLCTLFHYGLKPGRFLFLGSAETADSAADLFAPLDREARIYGARPQASQTLPILPQFAAPERLVGPGQSVAGRAQRPDLPGALHGAALESSAPPSALVDDGHAILHLSPSAGQFILPSAGPLSNLLPAVVHPELRLDLRLALTRALESKEPTLTLPVTIAMAGGKRRIAMHVIPVPKAAHMAAQALVLFLDGGAAPDGGELEASPDTRPDEVRRLHAELKASQEALVASRTGHEVAIQDLRATNEELQSINEEYRSTAEELETSKEELQSINEELHTVNAELKSKLSSISIAHSDLQNLTTATDIGTLFLDPDLRIRMFTPPIAELFNVTAADVGRTITDFTHRLDYDGLEADARRVLRDLAPVETEIRSKEGSWYVVRLRPYRTVEDRIDGTVVTFVDNTARHKAEAALRDGEERFRAFVTASSDVVYQMSPDWSEMRQLRGRAFLRDMAEPSGTWLDRYIFGEDQPMVRAAIDRAVQTRSIFELEHRVIRADGTLGWTLSRAVPILTVDGRIKEWLGAATDITERVLALEALRESEALRRVALAGGRMGTWRWDLGNRLVQGDPVFLALWGFPPSDDPLALSLFTERMSPEGAAQVEAIVTKAIKADEEFDGPLEVVAGPAAGNWLRWRGRPSASSTSVLYGVTFDITEQKRAEARLLESELRARTVLDGINEAFYALDAESRFLFASRSALKLWGRQPGEVIGTTMIESFPAVVGSEVWEAHLRVMRTRVAEHFETVAPMLGRWIAIDFVPTVNGGLSVAFRDIEERKRAEMALRESEERFRLAMQAVEAMVFDWDVPSGRVVRSDGLRRLLGYSPGEAAENTDWWAERIHPEDRASVGWPARDAMVAGAPRFEARVRLQHRDGHWVDVVDTGTILYDAEGRPRRIVGSSVDVTTRKRAEDALRESEERFRQFGEASQDVLWIRDAATFQWEYLTPAFETIYGLDRVAALGGDNMANWLDLILPEDRAHGQASLGRVHDGEWVTFEFRIRRPADGEVRWLRNTDFPIRDEAGQVIRIGGIGHDVTELKRTEDALAAAERRQRALLEGIPQLVWRAVDGGEWTWASPQWTEFTGQTEAESHGWGWLDTLHPDDRGAARQAWATAAERGGFEVEHRIRMAGSDSYRWFQTRATPVRDGSGAIVEWLGTSNDIDDLRGYQERQAVLVAELQHRTRNLMGVVRSTADMTLRSSSGLDEFAAKFRDRLTALARVQGLLSRLNEGERVTFDALIGAELNAVGQTGGSARVTLDGPAGIALRSSTVQTFAMALHELATNALKYGALMQPGGHLAVTWRLEREADGLPWLHVDWVETGIVTPPPGTAAPGGGAGRTLIERALPYQLGARTTYVLTPDGVRCSISLPVSDAAAGGDGPHGGLQPG